MDDLDLGARISYWRERRGMTQQLLADRVGRSKSWLEKVEAGTRSADRLPVLLIICRELRIDLPVLIGRDLDRDAASREVICRPVARATIENLVQRSRGKPSSALRALAVRAGAAA